MNKKDIECPYCKSVITVNDTTCPKCGANCSKEIKEYKEAEQKRRQEQAEQISKQIKTPFTIVSIVIAAGFIFMLVMIILSATVFSRSSEQIKGTVEGDFKTESYTVKIDKFEEYEYHDDFFKDCNTRDGYKRIAFYIEYTNKSKDNISTSSFINNLIVKADDEVLSKSSIHANSHFCEVVTGKEEYTAFPVTEVLPNDKVAGYVGYEVPVTAKKIKFIFSKNQILEIENPVYNAAE